MRAGAVPSTIRIATRIALELRAGERVTVEVLKSLGDGKWAVGLKGRVFAAATSATALDTGDRLSAVVQRVGRHIVLRLTDSDAAPASPGAPTADALAQIVARAFLREGRVVDDATLGRVTARMRALSGPRQKTARGLAVAVGKGIDPDSPGISELFSVLHFEDSEDRGGYRRRRLPRRESEQAAAVKGELARGRGESSLALFNALRSDAGTWVAVPFSFHYGIHELEGTARFLYVGSRPVRLALDVRGASSWSFLLSERSGERRLQVFCAAAGGGDRRVRRARAGLAGLRAKLQNHGVEVDDSISDARLFDGYSAEPGEAGVDLMG